MKRIILVAVTMLILGLASGVQADFINFRGDYFKTADDDPYFIYEPAGLAIYPGPHGSTLYWDKKDGFGVRTSDSTTNYEYDEIEGTEYLHLSFETSQILKNILITDLFVETYTNTSGSYLETGFYSFDNESWTSFFADSSQLTETSNGELNLIIPSLEITDIWFMAPGKLSIDGKKSNHEFSVAGIDVTPVPEPATMLLLGSGLAGIFGLRKRFKK